MTNIDFQEKVIEQLVLHNHYMEHITGQLEDMRIELEEIKLNVDKDAE